MLGFIPPGTAVARTRQGRDATSPAVGNSGGNGSQVGHSTGCFEPDFEKVSGWGVHPGRTTPNPDRGPQRIRRDRKHILIQILHKSLIKRR